jgi:hypothetical protein
VIDKIMGRPTDPNKIDPKAHITALQTRRSVSPTYNPDALLDALKVRLNLKNDAQLSRVLHVAPPIISKLRHRRLEVSDTLLVRIHDVTQLSINDLRKFMGVVPVVYGAAVAVNEPEAVAAA